MERNAGSHFEKGGYSSLFDSKARHRIAQHDNAWHRRALQRKGKKRGKPFTGFTGVFSPRLRAETRPVLLNQPEKDEMSIRSMTATFKGIGPLLMNNPQTVDRFNEYTKAMARINAKKTRRTDEDYRDLADIEVRAKIYWDNDEVKRHITEGKLPTELGLSYDGSVSFVLTEGGSLKKINFLAAPAEGDSGADLFDTNVVLATGQLTPCIDALIEALGGEMEREGGAA